MNKAVEVTCDKCSAVIRLIVKEKVIDKDENQKNIVEQYFKCPKCGKHYRIFIHDEYIRQRINARENMRKGKGYNKAYDERLMYEIDERYKKLNIQYS